MMATLTLVSIVVAFIDLVLGVMTHLGGDAGNLPLDLPTPDPGAV